VALAAYAFHAAQGPDQARLQLAAALAFGHGVALATLAPSTRGSAGRAALLLMLAGMLLFCGSLVGAAFADAPSMLAPAGGLAMIAGWLLLAADRLRG
jgi:uncharacterized membrane protein YgdD (TMEM256/DUF423 family)